MKREYVGFIIFLALLLGCPRNRPPKAIEKPVGPDQSYQYASVPFKFYTTDPEKHDIIYIIDWGDGKVDTSEAFGSGETASVSHRYTQAGTFAVKAKPKDIKGVEQKEWSKEKSIEILPNEKPTNLSISGYSSGSKKAVLEFKVTATDPDNDSIQFIFLWKKGVKSKWSHFVASGGIVSDTHTFKEPGQYGVKAIARDKKGGESDTSAPFLVNIVDEGYPIKDKKFKTDDEDGFYSSPCEALVGGKNCLVVGCEDGQVYALEIPKLTKEKSRSGVAPPGGEPDPFTATVAAGGGYIYIANDGGYFHILNTDLGNHWVYPTDSPDMTIEVHTAPAVFPPYVAFFGGPNGETLYVLDVGQKTARKFSFPQFTIKSSPVVTADNELIFGADSGGVGIVCKVDLVGNVRRLFYTDIIIDERSPILDAQGNIYIGTETKISSLTPDGHLRWEKAVENRPAIGMAIGPDNYLYFGDEGGKVYALSLTNGASKTGFPITIEGAAFYSAPCFAADNIFYLLDDDEILYAIKIDGTIYWFCEVLEAEKVKSVRQEDPEVRSPIIGPDGTIYVPASDGVYAIKGRTSGTPANTPWPRWRGNNQNTGKR